MNKHEKVIKGLEYCIGSASGACPDKCPYKKECISRDYMYVPMRDALELLKGQETELCDRCGRRRLISNRVKKEG